MRFAMVSLTKQKHCFTTIFDALPRPYFRALAGLDRTIHPHRPRFDLVMGKTTRMTKASRFKRLVKLDVLAAYGQRK